MSASRRVSWIAVVALAAALPSGVRAAPRPTPAAAAGDEAEALRRYEAARRLFGERDYAAALVEIEASLALLPSPNSELLKAHALRSLGRPAGAMASYERAVEGSVARVRAGASRYEATLAEAGRWAALLRPSVVAIEVLVTGAPEGTTVLVDGAPVETKPTARGRFARVWHAPGRTEVSVRAPGAPEQRRGVELAAGSVAKVELDLAPPGARAAPDAPAVPGALAAPGARALAPTTPARPTGIRSPPAASWIAAGVGAAGVGAFAVFGAQAASAHHDLLATCSPACPEGRRGEAEAGKRDQTIANVGLAVGITGVAASALFWLLWPEPARDPARRSVAPALGGIAARF